MPNIVAIFDEGPLEICYTSFYYKGLPYRAVYQFPDDIDEIEIEERFQNALSDLSELIPFETHASEDEELNNKHTLFMVDPDY